MTFQEQYIIKLCGDIVDLASELPAIHGHELADINFHLRAIQNIVYTRPTITEK